MHPRALALALLLASGCALASASGDAGAPSEERAAAPALATRPALTFFSSLSEAPFARLEAEAVEPRFTRHGPFRVPAPGVEIRTPRLQLHDQPCSPGDWAHFLEAFAAWSPSLEADEFLLLLPDHRLLLFLGPPRVEPGALTGLVRPLLPAPGETAPPERALLRVTHDGEARLRISLTSPDSAALPSP